ncbi:MAG TPA: RidA family protein [Acetobacteraceae bacterium]|nr:RidA family protein [Acetobacteraceae bacterium]
MERTTFNAPDAPAPAGGYAQAVQVAGGTRILHISGQVPVTVAGAIPATFREQCRLAWANVEAQLRAADMTLDNLVKTTVFLADRQHRFENREVRQEVLGGRQVATTLVIAGIFDEAWLIEIEAVAIA